MPTLSKPLQADFLCPDSQELIGEE